MIVIYNKQITMRRIIQRINQLSFSRRLAVTFFICSFLTFLVIDVIMNILYATVVTSTTEGSNFNTESFSIFANNQILSSTQAALQSNVDIYEQMLTQIYTTYHHFQNSSLYLSRLEKGKNPPLSTTFARKRYDRSSVYLFNQNSTFYDDPFIDKILASLITEHYPVYLKRINVIYQSQVNETDISIRTIPSTKDFYVPNVDTITKRFNNLKQGIIDTSDWYIDELSLSDNQTQLFALRLIQSENSQNGPVKILIQAQIERKLFSSILESVISFKNTMLALIKYKNTQYSIIGHTSNILPEVNFKQFLVDGNKNVVLGNSQFLVTTKTLQDDNNNVQSQIHNYTTSEPMQAHNKATDFKLIIFLNKAQAGAPNVVYDQFVINEYSVLVFVLYGWTFIVLLFVIAIGVVVGDIIFSYFVLIRKKCKQYLQNPEQLSLLQDQMKQELKNQGRNRMVLENIVLIMQRIENKKRQNRKNFKIQYDQYPLNPLNMKFQTKMKLDSYNKLQEISKIVQKRQEYLK